MWKCVCCCQRVVATIEEATQTCFDSDMTEKKETEPLVQKKKEVKNVLTQQPSEEKNDKEWDMC